MQQKLTMNKSPLRYPGGKTRACKVLHSIVSERFDMSQVRRLRSPFFGGGSFEMHLQNLYPHLQVIANDKYKPLICFWTACKKHNQHLAEAVAAVQAAGVLKEDFDRHKLNIANDAHASEGDPEGSSLSSLLSTARDFYVINRCSFSGCTMSGGFSPAAKRFTPSSVARIAALNLDRYTFHQGDFDAFLHLDSTGADLLFVDPPYALERGSTLYGSNGNLHRDFDHERLRDTLLRHPNWVLTYNDCERVREMYAGVPGVEFIDGVEWSYGMNKSKLSNELVLVRRA